MHFTTAALVAALVATASAWSQVNHCYSSGPGNYNKENIINELPALCNMISGYFVETQTRFGSLADGNNCWDFYITKSSKNAGIMTAGDCVANIGGQINVCANGGLTRQGSPSWDFRYLSLQSLLAGLLFDEGTHHVLM